jgi:dodecin
MFNVILIAAWNGNVGLAIRILPRKPSPKPRMETLQMNDHVYSITEIIGTSKTNVEDAVKQGIKTAAKTLKNLEWFEVTQIKGHIVDGGVGHYQVCMKLGSRYEAK